MESSGFSLFTVPNLSQKGTSLGLQPRIFDVTEEPGLEYDIKQIKDWHESFQLRWRDLNAFLDRLPPALRAEDVFYDFSISTYALTFDNSRIPKRTHPSVHHSLCNCARIGHVLNSSHGRTTQVEARADAQRR